MDTISDMRPRHPPMAPPGDSLREVRCKPRRATAICCSCSTSLDATVGRLGRPELARGFFARLLPDAARARSDRQLVDGPCCQLPRRCGARSRPSPSARCASTGTRSTSHSGGPCRTSVTGSAAALGRRCRDADASEAEVVERVAASLRAARRPRGISARVSSAALAGVTRERDLAGRARPSAACRSRTLVRLSSKPGGDTRRAAERRDDPVDLPHRAPGRRSAPRPGPRT